MHFINIINLFIYVCIKKKKQIIVPKLLLKINVKYSIHYQRIIQVQKR